jgi:hypothetical protein
MIVTLSSVILTFEFELLEWDLNELNVKNRWRDWHRYP